MYQGEDGSSWMFKHTHDWIDYHGSISPKDETGFLGTLLTSKPQLFEIAITNKDYKLTVVGEDVMMAVEIKSVFETVTIRLKRDEMTTDVEVRQLKGRVGELEKEQSVLTEKLKVEMKEIATKIVPHVGRLVGKIIESLVGKMVESLEEDMKQLKGNVREVFGLLVREREEREGRVRELEKEMGVLTKKVESNEMVREREEREGRVRELEKEMTEVMERVRERDVRTRTLEKEMAGLRINQKMGDQLAIERWIVSGDTQRRNERELKELKGGDTQRRNEKYRSLQLNSS
jgi:hypothetical protein